MIEFGEIKHVEEPYTIHRSNRDIKRFGSLVSPNLGTLLVLDADGALTDEEIGIRLEDGRFAATDDERNIDMLSAHTTQALYGVNLVPKSLLVGERVVFTRMPGFTETIQPFDLPKRKISFAHKAGNWALVSQYRFSLHTQAHGRGIPTLDDDRY